MSDFKNIIDDRLVNLTIDYGLKDRIAKGINNKSKQNNKRILVVAAVICICIVFSVPVLASNIPSLKKLVKLVGAQTSLLLQPVQMISESNGIKMEVLAAMNDEDMTVVYLTMQDTLGKGRVDKTVDLYDYSIQGGITLTHEVIDYDKDTQTATIRLFSNGVNLEGKKIKVSINSFLSGKEYYENVDTAIDLSGFIGKKSETMKIDTDKITGGGFIPGKWLTYEEMKAKVTIDILKPLDKPIRISGVDFVDITNIGFIDGYLHVQTKWAKSIDNHGYVYLVDKDGNIIKPSNIYMNFSNKIDRDTYITNNIEYILDVRPENLNKYSLKAYLVKSKNYIEGQWETTFQIKAVDGRIKALKSVKIGEKTINFISVSALGITLFGESQSIGSFSIKAIMKNGTEKKFESTISTSSEGVATAKYLANEIINVDDIKEIIINGNVVRIN